GANTRRLADLGIKVHIGHRADNVGNAQVVVVSSAVKKDNPEVLAARSRVVPVVRRAEMLGELMRLKWSIAVGGTHGKTTTTSMVASMLDAGGLDPTVINGGIINAYGTNARIGGGDWMVVESDESDGSFLRLPATIAVVTNTGEAHGITVIDDYGHHPVEIAAVLRAARQAFGGSGRVIAVMQPHRYTRLAALKNEFATCFADADTVLISDVYAAGEAPIEGVNRDMLVGLVQRAGHR